MKALRRRSQSMPTLCVRPQPSTFTWFCRLDRDVDVIDQWLAKLTDKAQAKFERARDQLSQLPWREWHRPNPVSFINNHIYVIRFTDEARKQWRVFGHADDVRHGFVLSIIATEKDDTYNPIDAATRAAKFRDICDADPTGHSCVCFAE